MNREEVLERTAELWRLLPIQEFENPDWHRKLDELFLDSAFGFDPAQPLRNGPDGLIYFFAWHPEPAKPYLVPRNELDQLVEKVLGWAILGSDGNPVYIYSAGDIVALKLYGHTQVSWQGGWAVPPDMEEYRAGGTLWEGPPNDVMLPPLAARCLEADLRRLFARYPAFKDRVPSIKVVRLSSHEKPEDASDLSVNVWPDDFENDSKLMDLVFKRAGCHLPRHLRTRLISGVGSGGFKPLRTIVEDAGLTLANV